MTRVQQRRWWSAVVALSLVACAPKEVNYALKIVTQSCDSAANPFDGVQFLKVIVRGINVDANGVATPFALEETSAASPATRELRIPLIPAGSDRTIEVRAYESDPNSGGRVISMGKTVPFDVPDVVPTELTGPIPVNVILRRVGTFSPVVSAAAPTQCQQLRVSRAGHTATLLEDGRVFIAGGFNLRQGSPEKRALSDTELYNPNTGAFEQARPLSISAQGTVYELPRAYHAAIRIPNGQVVLWGGETYGGGTANTVSPIASIIFYDPVADDFGAVGPRTPPAIGRSRHSMAMDKDGKVLVVGGVTRKSSLVPADEVEWLDPAASSNLYKIVDGVTLPRLGAAVMPVKKGEFIAVVGGADAAALRNEIVFFRHNGTTFAQQTVNPAPRLSDPGRRGGAGALVRNNEDLVVLGGYSDATAVRPLSSSEILTASTATVGAGPDVREARGDICAVTMGDGSVLAVGGRTSNSLGQTRSDPTSILVTAGSSGSVTSLSAPNLPRARYNHTCTPLLDGTVLITGGIDEQLDGSFEVLQDAWIYTPVPPAGS